MSPERGGGSPSFFVGFPLAFPAALDDVPPPPPKVRLFMADDLHLTLAFFGSSGLERAKAGFAAVDASAMSSVEVTLGGARLLGNPRHPTAIARVLELGAAVLTGYVAAQRDAALAAAGLPPERRDPLPHLTIARLSRRATVADRMRAEAWMRTIAPNDERLRVDRVALFTWSEERTSGGLSPDGGAERPRQFRIVDERALGAT